MNELPVRVVSQRDGRVERAGRQFATPGVAELGHGAAALLLVRPESLRPLQADTVADRAAPVLRGRVEVQTFLGATTRLPPTELPLDGGDAAAIPAEARIQGHLAVDAASAAAGHRPAGPSCGSASRSAPRGSSPRGTVADRTARPDTAAGAADATG